jgi:hypothetical protein
MKKISIALLLVSLTLLPAAYPQQNGIAEGRLVNLTNPSNVPRNIELEIIELGGGMNVIRSARTDASGKFRIEGLPEDQRLMIRADYKGASYYAQMAFTNGKATVELDVYEPTTSMKDIVVDEDTIAFQVVGDQLKSVETVTIDNKTNPPRTIANPEGNFRISKPPGILEVPNLRVTAPGSSMPLVQSALESADGKSYYSLYPLRPGRTVFEVQLLLPYADRRYTFMKKFYQDTPKLQIGVLPEDLVLSGAGLSKIQTDSQNNFSVYSSVPVKAGTEAVWEFSGGTPVPEAASTAGEGEPQITAMPNAVGRISMIIGPLLLMGLVLVLWYAYTRPQNGSRDTSSDFRQKKIRERREQLVSAVAELDRRYEGKLLEEQEYLKQREESKRQLRRISLLMK